MVEVAFTFFPIAVVLYGLLCMLEVLAHPFYLLAHRGERLLAIERFVYHVERRFACCGFGVEHTVYFRHFEVVAVRFVRLCPREVRRAVVVLSRHDALQAFGRYVVGNTVWCSVRLFVELTEDKLALSAVLTVEFKHSVTCGTRASEEVKD